MSHLSEPEADRFYRLYFGLLAWARGRMPAELKLPKVHADTQRGQDPDAVAKVADALLQHPRLVGAYCDENPDGRNERDLRLVRSWAKAVKGKFIIERYLVEGAVFLGHKDGEAWIVSGPRASVEEILSGFPLPAPLFVEATVMPYEGRMLCNGLMFPYAVRIGPGMRDGFKEEYRKAKAAGKVRRAFDGEEAQPVDQMATPSIAGRITHAPKGKAKAKEKKAPVTTGSKAHGQVPCHTLKIMLSNIRPPCWRRLSVPSDRTLDDLHRAIQESFNWMESHLHSFRQRIARRPPTAEEMRAIRGAGLSPASLDALRGEREFSDPSLWEGDGARFHDSRDAKLGEVCAKVGDTLVYTYDFGDDWRHQIKVEKISPGPDRIVCLKGKRDLWLEDCGGPWSEEAQIHDPEDEELDLEAVNEGLEGL